MATNTGLDYYMSLPINDALEILDEVKEMREHERKSIQNAHRNRRKG